MAEEIGVAYLSVKPKMDDGFDSDLKSHGTIGGTKFGGAFAVAAGNLIASAISKAITGAFDIIGDAFANYADFEQLAGGVEKIFDQADIEGIFRDAQAAYKDLNMSANEYLESINKTGAAFAQTMGDQRGYDVARQGMKAISDYASGTGRDLDELNEKFALISRSTSSYQSIADQFSGILPATSADFLAQAQAAGLLSTEYTKLTEVPIAEYQQALAAMLEKGVDDMGLLGNTAAESTETISGSLAMLRASWSNFTTELGKDSADMPARTQELVDSIVAVVQNIAPRLLEFAKNLFAAIPELYEQLKPYIDEFIAMAGQFIEEHQPEIQAAAEQLFDGITKALSVILELAIQALIDAIGDMIKHLPEFHDAMAQAALELFLSIVEGLVNGLKPFFENLENSMNEAIATIGGFFSDFFNAGAGIINNIVDGVSSVLGTVRGIFEDVVYAMTHPLETAEGIIRDIANTISNIFGGMRLELPRIALPHFWVYGGSFPWGIGGAGSMPQFGVDWYGSGGFADQPTLTGYGERGLELYWPGYAPYFDKYAKGIAEHMPAGAGGVDIHDCTFNVRRDSDIRAIAVELNTLINRQTAGGIA